MRELVHLGDARRSLEHEYARPVAKAIVLQFGRRLVRFGRQNRGILAPAGSFRERVARKFMRAQRRAPREGRLVGQDVQLDKVDERFPLRFRGRYGNYRPHEAYGLSSPEVCRLAQGIRTSVRAWTFWRLVARAYDQWHGGLLTLLALTRCSVAKTGRLCERIWLVWLDGW